MHIYHRLAETVFDRAPLGLFEPLARRALDERIASAISTDSVVTFDAFDTLITRPFARPGDLFLVVGHRLARNGLIGIGAEQWAHLRRAAELAARRAARGREVTLIEIYARLRSSMPDLDVDRARAVEVAVEKALIRPIASSVAALTRCAETHPTAILSDIYLDEPDLRAMCAACGIDVARTAVHASSESGDTKSSGRLFRAAKAPGKRRIHVGDNLFADGWRALHAGCRPLPFLESRPNRLEGILAGADIAPAVLRSTLAGSARTARLRTTTVRSAAAIAAASTGFSGPLLLAFVVWTLKRARDQGICKLYFLARDGEILIEIARRVVRMLGLKMELRYLYVSRQALHLPALAGLGQESFDIFGFDENQTLAEMLGKLGLSDSPTALFRLRELGLDQPTSKPLSAAEIGRFVAALNEDAALREQVEASAAEHRDVLLAYLAQEGLLEPEPFAVVDIGWRGNLQRSLCRVLETVEPDAARRVSGYYYGLYARPADAGRLDAFIDHAEASDLRPYVRGSMFEALCAARHGTTLRYARGIGGEAAPVLAASANTEAQAWGLAIQQDAMLAFVDDLLAALDWAGESILDHGAALAKASALVAAAFVKLPSRDEAKALGSFPHAANQSHKTFDELAPRLPMSPLEWLRRFRARGATPMISYWPEASLVRSMPAPLAHGLVLGLERFRARRERRRQRDATTMTLAPRLADQV